MYQIKIQILAIFYYAHYLFIKMEVVSCGEAKLTTAAGLPDWLISIWGDLRATMGLSMIWASGEQKVVNLGLRLRRTVLLEAAAAEAVWWGCIVEAAEVVEAAEELLPAALGESNCVSLMLLLLRLEVVSGLRPDLTEAAEAVLICSRQLEPPVCFSSTFGRCEERPVAEAKLGG